MKLPLANSHSRHTKVSQANGDELPLFVAKTAFRKFVKGKSADGQLSVFMRAQLLPLSRL